MNKLFAKLKNIYFRTKFGYSILLLGAIMLIALPFVTAASMTFFVGDDFAQLPIKSFEGNGIELFPIALRYAKHMYLEWQGAYFSMFINVLLHPILGGGISQLRTVMVVNALLFVAGTIFFVWGLCKEEISSRNGRLLLILCCFWGVLGFECWDEIFYWYTGTAGYTIPFSLLLFALAIVTVSNKKLNYIIAGILIFCASGGSQTIAGAGCYWMLVLIIAKALKKRLCIKDIIVFGVGVVGAFLNVIAPGNYVRHDVIDDSGLHFFRAMIYSFSGVIETGERLFIDYPFIIIATIAFVIGVNIGKTKCVDKVYSWIMIILHAAAPVVAYFPVCLGYSSSGSPNRCKFVLTFVFVVSSVMIFVFLGEIFAVYFHKDYRKEIVVIIIILAITMPTERENWKLSSSIPYRTVMAMAEGQIQSYYHTVNEIYDTIQEDENEDVFIYNIPETLDVFFTVGIHENPDYLLNRECANFFGKNSIQYVPNPVYKGEATYVRIAPSYFEHDLSYVSIFVNKDLSGTETVQVLKPFEKNKVLKIPKGETGSVVMYVFADSKGEDVIEELEILF